MFSSDSDLSASGIGTQIKLAESLIRTGREKGIDMEEFINTIFSVCVVMLQDLAKVLGMTYREVNVWIFCILWPIFTIYLVVRIIQLKEKIRKLQLGKE